MVFSKAEPAVQGNGGVHQNNNVEVKSSEGNNPASVVNSGNDGRRESSNTYKGELHSQTLTCIPT